MSLFKKVFLALTFCLVFSNCSNAGNRLKEWMKDSEKPHVLSTTAQIGDLVAEIGGGRVEALVLIQGDLDPHSYELVKGDDEKFFRADLIFYNGLGLEHGASLSSLLRSNPKTIPIGEKIVAAQPTRILKKGDVIDPHIWMDISLWKEAIVPIIDHLSAIDPEGAPYYRERGEALALKMDQTHIYVKELLQKVPSSKRYLITSHDAFRYFARSYLAEPEETDWALRFTAPEGLAPDGQLNPYDIQRIIDFLKQKQVSVLFPETNVSRDSIRKIASAGKELGLEIKICTEPLYGDSMSGLSYLEMMQKNGEVISRYLP